MRFEYETQTVNGQECKVKKLYYGKELVAEEQIVDNVVNGFFHKYDGDEFYKTIKYKSNYYGFLIAYTKGNITEITLRFSNKIFYEFKLNDKYAFRYSNGDWTDPDVDLYKVYEDKATHRVLNSQEEIEYQDMDKQSALNIIKNEVNIAHNEAKEYTFKVVPYDVAENISKQIDETSTIVYDLLNC